ncbi:acyl-CoA dehydrogenase family protein [Streptomyces fuscichromogenes]|uniref:Acyl-CoA dehydrogenase n=1 Tax=Streptomyces fuscichromogenes TaxID=1324013 RepID=A0A917XNQ5_9ACTN|nr:acyl-CoA dehydrogenase family protein [Streptomyces fuscichromogenes]GGN44157.1 acyl-CoA dehydrogenase [Streptomyces fuscichromogenes]
MSDRNDEHDELRKVVRAFLEHASPSSEVRRLAETDEGYDPEVWRRLADELGLVGLIVPERFGGAGAGAAELAVVMAEMGRTLLCAPYLSSAVLAPAALLESGDETACAEFLPDIADGSVIATLAVAEGNSDIRDLDAVWTTARADGDRHLLFGTKERVTDGYAAGLLLTVARTEKGLSLFAVDPEAVERRPLPALDPTRKLARVHFDRTPARLIGAEGAAEGAVARVLDLGAVALAAEQAGGAERCLELSVEYAKTREQFGRPIGAFQAIKHKCAELLYEVESAKAAAQDAARLWSAAAAASEQGLAASVARAYCSETYVHAAAETIQIHGGIGYTWEHDAHLYLRRAKSSALLLGSTSWHLERVAADIGLVPTA